MTTVGRPKLAGGKTVKELAEDLRFTITAPADPEAACRDWLSREGIVGVRRGRRLLFSEGDINRHLHQEASARTRANRSTRTDLDQEPLG